MSSEMKRCLSVKQLFILSLSDKDDQVDDEFSNVFLNCISAFLVVLVPSSLHLSLYIVIFMEVIVRLNQSMCMQILFCFLLFRTRPQVRTKSKMQIV